MRKRETFADFLKSQWDREEQEPILPTDSPARNVIMERDMKEVHETEIIEIKGGIDPDMPRYQAICKTCPWKRSPRYTLQYAQDDAYEHQCRNN